MIGHGSGPEKQVEQQKLEQTCSWYELSHAGVCALQIATGKCQVLKQPTTFNKLEHQAIQRCLKWQQWDWWTQT